MSEQISSHTKCCEQSVLKMRSENQIGTWRFKPSHIFLLGGVYFTCNLIGILFLRPVLFYLCITHSPAPITRSMVIQETSISLANSWTAWLGSSYVWGSIYVRTAGNLTVMKRERTRNREKEEKMLIPGTSQLLGWVMFCNVRRCIEE